MGRKVLGALEGSLEFSKKHGSLRKGRELAKTPHKVVGLDMEADPFTAEPYLLAWDSGSKGRLVDLEDWRSVVQGLTVKETANSVNFFYNLQYDFEGFARFLEKEVSVRLLGGATVGVNQYGEYVEERPTYKIRYVPKKAFSVCKPQQKQTWQFFDAYQYFLMSLEKAVTKNLPGKRKMVEVDVSESGKERYRFDAKYREDVRDRCLSDAELCRELATLIVEGANRFVNTKDFYSSAGVSELYFRSNGFRIPRIRESVHRAFMRTYHGGRFEMMKRGYMEGVTSEDIKSAYPFAMSRMPILTDGCKTKTVTGGSRDGDALYGAYSVDVYVPDDWYMGPVVGEIQGTLCFPVGDHDGVWVDIPTIELLENLGLDVAIREGVEIFDREPGTLFELIMGLYRIKEDKTQPPSVRYAAKINLNGLYGKLIQLIDDVTFEELETLEDADKMDYGELIQASNKFFTRRHTGIFKTGALFAPFYASHVTSVTRRMEFERAREVGFENVISLHTDSIQHTGVPCESGNELGAWEIESTGGTVEIVKCGFYKMIDGEGQIKVRSRGIGPTDDISLDSYSVKRRFGMTQAIRNDWERLNIIEPRQIIQNLNTDKKRIWRGELPRDYKERGLWIDSMPIHTTY